MPPDFADVATLPARELALRYHISHKTVARWRRELGIRLPPGAPKGNANAIGSPSRAKSTHGIDGPEQVRACLSCKRPRCTGQCELVR